MIRTIKQGERALLWKPNGERQLIDGPQRLIRLFADLRVLPKFHAEADEYLVVRFQDGRCEHRPGPAVEWLDPVEHQGIEVREAIELDAHEALVIYKTSEGDEVVRRVLCGPALHFPEPDEWLHEFSWHGSGARGPGHGKHPHGLCFNKLRIIPDQMYFDIDEVRTSDEALLTVKAMLFFELVDIERMLDRTHDPIADFINALTADVINFAAGDRFEAFKRRTEALSEQETYPQLLARAEAIGYRIDKVVYRGYGASSKLQEMHDSAIEARTQLVLESETEQQSQQLEDFRLEREVLRERTRREEEQAKAAHERSLARAEHEEELRRVAEMREAEANHKRETNAIDLNFRRDAAEQRLVLLAGMRDLDADLTQVLVAENRNPDRVIELKGGGDPSLLLQESA
jgi:hypothetical protein